MFVWSVVTFNQSLLESQDDTLIDINCNIISKGYEYEYLWWCLYKHVNLLYNFPAEYKYHVENKQKLFFLNIISYIPFPSSSTT